MPLFTTPDIPCGTIVSGYLVFIGRYTCSMRQPRIILRTGGRSPSSTEATEMKSCLTALAAAFLLFPIEAVAQDNRGQTFQDCGEGTPRSIIETGPQVAFNDFGEIDQTVLGVSGTLGLCMTGSRMRWRLEGNYVNVDEDLYNANGVLIGLGFTARLIDGLPGLTVTPIGRLGSEKSSDGQSDFLYGGSVAFEFVAPIGSGVHASGPGVQLVLVERPEFVFRSVVRSSVPISSGLSDTFSNFASAGLDGSFGTTSRWRWKAGIATTSIAEDVPTNQIFSGIVSIRPTSRSGASYPWSIELWLSRGNGNYRGVLVSFTLRFD